MKFSAEEMAFRRAIIADPNNDEPRLIFSDWLEERGETARSQFIRVQCRIAEVEKGDSVPKCTIEELKHLLNQQLSTQDSMAIYLHSYPLEAEAPIGGMWSFGRGFVDHIHCTYDWWMKHGPEVMQYQPVTVLRVGDKDPTRIRSVYNSPEKAGWYTRQFDEDTSDADDLHKRIHDRLAGFSDVDALVRSWKFYSSVEDAEIGLSQAMIAWALAEPPG